MPATYRAAIMPGPHEPIRVEEFPAPTLMPGAALLHTLYSEVCGTDVHLHHGKLQGVPYPLIPGHVSVGVIAEVNGRVYDVEGKIIKEGEPVTFLDVAETCNACYECLVTKQPTRCPHRKVYGVTYGAKDGLLGGWSEAIWIPPGVKLLRFPPGLRAETFIGGGCGLVTSLHAVDLGGIRLGQSVAVLGVGPVGQSAIALAALSGAAEVIAIGAPSDRLAFARRMGATQVLGLDIPSEDRATQVRAWTRGKGVDLVIEATGAPDAVSQALDLVRDGGRVVIAGHYTNNGPVSLHPHFQINKKHVEIKGCWGSEFHHFFRALDIAARFGDRFPWGDLVKNRYPLERAGEALDAVANRAVLKAIIAPQILPSLPPAA